MSGALAGGNDLLVGGDGATNYLVGDAFVLADGARGGNDRLVGGAYGEDHMWGDSVITPSDTGGSGGRDTFVILKDGGADCIYDFRESDGDRIDLQTLDLDFGSLLTMATDQGNDVFIDLGAGNSLTLIGLNVTDLRAGFFLL